jgi:TPR repeat protein
MKRVVAGMILSLGMGVVCADELADAGKALDAKNYPQALALYTKLASAGNPEAALRLGEMYWYGEGAPLDRAKGDALFAQAAAAGNQAAVASTSLSSQRQKRIAEITYWTSTYDGADLVAGKFNCVEPEFPKYSDTKRKVAAVSNAADTYTACYNGFIDNLAGAMPPGKRIPEEVVLLMSEQELGQAREHLVKIYTQAAARGKLTAERAVAQRAEWMKQTEEYLKTQNLREAQLQAEMDRQRTSNNMTSTGARVGSAAAPLSR